MQRPLALASRLLILLLIAGCRDGGSVADLRQPQPVDVPEDGSDELRAALTLLNASDPLARARGARLLGECREDPERLGPPLQIALGDPNLLVRARAAESLGQVGDPAAVTPLVKRLEDRSEDREVRTRAAEALGRLGSEEAVEPLLDVLDDPVWHIRYHAIVALGQIGDAAALEGLEEATRYDPDPFNREEAAQALRRLGRPDEQSPASTPTDPAEAVAPR
jgi:HEAT repeat protein